MSDLIRIHELVLQIKAKHEQERTVSNKWIFEIHTDGSCHLIMDWEDEDIDRPWLILKTTIENAVSDLEAELIRITALRDKTVT